MTDRPLPERGWMPIRVSWRGDQPWVDWIHLGEARFTEPFFDATIQRCLKHPFNLIFQHQTPIEDIGKWLGRLPPAEPDGFIFHMSRCGSTLVAQMLAALNRNIVLSEAPPIETVLEAKFRPGGASDEQRLLWLQWLIGAMSYRRSAGERQVFIKFDAWHVLDLPLIRRAFPAVPWIFLYRHPLEVMMSQLKQRGSYLVPGIIPPSRIGIDQAAALHTPAEEYCARGLTAICAAGLRYALQYDGMLINYDELPGAVLGPIAEHFGLDCTVAERAMMEQAAAFDAKTPSLYYTSDTSAKRQAATDAAQAATEIWLESVYRELEAARAQQRPPDDPAR